MPLDIPPGYANISLKFNNALGIASASSSIAQAYNLTAGLTLADVQRIQNLWKNALKPVFDTQWNIGNSHAVWNNAGVLSVIDDPSFTAGTGVATNSATPAVAMVVSKKTGILGKRNRGRHYLPGVQEANVDEGGILAGATVTGFQVIYDALFASLVADAAIDELVVLHDISQGGITPTPMTQFLVRDVVGTMRPRQRR